ncbi:MAG: HK97 family phage prohead protease [Sphingomonadales bacterium]|nr:HK97 family phage prohead protease [Sphingomonadales bacterium]
MQREKRIITGRVECRALTADEKAAGYIGALTGIIPLNSDSVVLRDRRLNHGQPFVERIAPKCFEGAADVMAMAGHTEETLAAFARQGVNLTLTEGPQEIRYDALIPDTSAGRDLLELSAKKIVRGTSFEFEAGAEDKWEKRGDGTTVRTVQRGRLLTVNPVIWPAYDDSELTVTMRGRHRRDSYFGTDSAYDPLVSGDVAFAIESLGGELCELCDALEYLRENPTGALADYAREEAADAAEDVTMLTAWLAANGATVEPDMQNRAAGLLKAARAAAPLSQADHDRERRYRILTLGSR